MAYFGYYDNAGNQAAINAINAAIELNQKFIVIKNEWIKESNLNPKNVEINVKCGIHTGDLLFGIIDTEYRNQITVIGSTVNFASRLQRPNKRSRIYSPSMKKNVKSNHGEKLMSIL